VVVVQGLTRGSLLRSTIDVEKLDMSSKWTAVQHAGCEKRTPTPS
jgi:hypothetical protein